MIEILPFSLQGTESAALKLKFKVLAKFRDTVEHLSVYVGKPDLSVSKPRMLKEGDTFSVEVKLDAGNGDYRIEFICFGSAGPLVCNILTVPAKQGSGTAAGLPAARPQEGSPAEWLFAATNDLRGFKKLGVLSRDETLDRVAEKYSQQLAQGGTLSHVNFASGSLTDRLANAGFGFEHAAENLAVAGRLEDALDGFLRSPFHLANILGLSHSRMGIGLTRSKAGEPKRWWVVLIFASKRTGSAAEPLAARVLRFANEDRAMRGVQPLQQQPYISYLSRKIARKGGACDGATEQMVRKSLQDVGAPRVSKMKVVCGTTEDMDETEARVVTAPAILEAGLTHAGIGISAVRGQGEKFNFAVILVAF